MSRSCQTFPIPPGARYHAGIQYGSERQKGKGVLMKRVPPRTFVASVE